MRVIIAGGGIGGLALAQGLIRHDIEVTVIEPDIDLARTGGYKLHLGPRAMSALGRLLASELRQLLVDSAVVTNDFTLRVLDHRGRRLLSASDGAVGTSLDVDRITLRLVLATGLQAHLVTGVRVLDHDRHGDGVRVEASDGVERHADLVVYADGVRSTGARRLAGIRTSAPTGLVAVAGRSLVERLPESARRLLTGGPALAIGPGGLGLFLSEHDPWGGRPEGHRSLAVTTDPVVIWGLIAMERDLPSALAAPHPTAILGDGIDLMQRHRWCSGALDLVAAASPDTVAGFRLNAADPRRIAPWVSSRVTALGDAVHAMPPTGGQGAATAIRDAAVLADRLADAAAGRLRLVDAVHAYEREMRGYSAVAVRESLEPVRWIKAAATPVGSRVVRGLTAAVGTAVRPWDSHAR